MQDLQEDECLNERKFWTEVKHPELGKKITYPKTYVRSTEADMSIRFRAPLIGEHNNEIYKEIGISGFALKQLKNDGIV